MCLHTVLLRNISLRRTSTSFAQSGILSVFFPSDLTNLLKSLKLNMRMISQYSNHLKSILFQSSKIFLCSNETLTLFISVTAWRNDLSLILAKVLTHLLPLFFIGTNPDYVRFLACHPLDTFDAPLCSPGICLCVLSCYQNKLLQARHRTC